MTDDDFSKLGFMKKCPKCGGDPERGYLIIPRAIAWDTEKHKYGPCHGGILTRFTWNMNNIPAVQCRKRNIVVFNNEENAHRL